MATKREIIINYDRSLISLGEAATTEDVTAWLDNLAALIAEEFDADVSLCSGAWGMHGTCSHDRDVDARLQEIASGDEWIRLLPKHTAVTL